MKKVKLISALRETLDESKKAEYEKYGYKWALKLDAGKGEFDAWYGGKKDLLPLVGTEIEVIIEEKPLYGNPGNKFKVKFPSGGGAYGGKAHNPTPDQQMRMAAIRAAANSPGPNKTVKEMAEEYYIWIKG